VGQRGHCKDRGLYLFLWKRKRESSVENRCVCVCVCVCARARACVRAYVRACTCVCHRIVSIVKRVQFVSDRLSCIVLRGCWCDIIVLSVHAQSEEERDDSNDSFCEELEEVFCHFPKYHMESGLGYLNEKLGREDIFKLTIQNESLHQGSNDIDVRIVNFATSKIWLLRA